MNSKHTRCFMWPMPKPMGPKQGHLAEFHDDVHHVALLVALIVLDNVGVVQAVQHLHLILGLQHGLRLTVVTYTMAFDKLDKRVVAGSVGLMCSVCTGKSKQEPTASGYITKQDPACVGSAFKK
jgi:hypothetical protein